MKSCPDCGSRVCDLGCTWCNEALYIEQQNHFDKLAEWERRTEQQSQKTQSDQSTQDRR